MVFLFKSKAKQKQHTQNAIGNPIALSIIRKGIGLQLKWADYMQQETNRLSSPVKKGFLIAFCLLSCGFSIYLIARSFTNGQQIALPVTPIKLPSYLGKAVGENTEPLKADGGDTYQKIQRFRCFMDSLALSPQGKKIQESLLTTRPGLMDSIGLIEKIYALQPSKNNNHGN